jgi:DNA mismatch repair ATPase MutS
MTARIIDGNAIAKQIRRELADQVRALTIRALHYEEHLPVIW